MIWPYLKSRLFWHNFWHFGLPRLLWVIFYSAEWFGMEFRAFASIFVPRNGIPSCSPLLLKSSGREPESLLLIWFHGTEFRVVFSSAEWFGREFWEFASIFVQLNGIPSCFLFCVRVRNGIPRVFSSEEQPEFPWKQPFVSSIPSFTELFFCRKFPTLLMD